MNFKSTVISTILRLLVSLRRVKADPRQLRVRYVNDYLKQWDPLYKSKTSKQPIQSQRETPAMNQRRNISRVDPFVIGLSEDASLSAVRIFDHNAGLKISRTCTFYRMEVKA